MKKLLVSALLVSSLFLNACMNVKVSAPEGKAIKLGRKEKTEILKPTNEKTVYYALWGLVPLTDNSTEDLLEGVSEESKVVIETHFTLKDFWVNLFGSMVTITSQTVSVEEQK